MTIILNDLYISGLVCRWNWCLSYFTSVYLMYLRTFLQAAQSFYFPPQFLSSLAFRAIVTPALPWQCLWPLPTRASPAQPTWWVHTHHHHPTATILHHHTTRSSKPQRRSRSKRLPLSNTLQQVSDLSQDDTTRCCPEPLAAYNSALSSFKWLFLFSVLVLGYIFFLSCSLFNILMADRAACIWLCIEIKRTCFFFSGWKNMQDMNLVSAQIFRVSVKELGWSKRWTLAHWKEGGSKPSCVMFYCCFSCTENDSYLWRTPSLAKSTAMSGQFGRLETRDREIRASFPGTAARTLSCLYKWNSAGTNDSCAEAECWCFF